MIRDHAERVGFCGSESPTFALMTSSGQGFGSSEAAPTNVLKVQQQQNYIT
jgi:hypothetical protein